MLIALLLMVNWLAIRVDPASAYEDAGATSTPQEEAEDTVPRPAASTAVAFHGSLQEPAATSFKGYPCALDCSAHAAGYGWAELRGMSDPADCEGESASFIEGCRAYADERLEEKFRER